MSILNEKLVRCGADINEINVVRKHLSCKGRTACIKDQTRCCCDHTDFGCNRDHPDIIASGPTVPDNSTFADALNVLEKYNMTEHSACFFNRLYKGGCSWIKA